MTPSPENERRAAQSDRVDHVARVGLVVYGVLHLLVAWLVLRLASGDRSGSASGTGALHTLAQSAIGRVTLYAIAVGFAALGLWHGIEAVLGYHRFGFVEKLSNRLVSAVKVVVFAAIGVNALLLATGSSSSSGTGGSPDSYTARLMSLPAGPLLVGLVGAVIIVVGLVLAYFGLARNFRETMSHQGRTGRLGKAYVLLGVVGYVSRGIAIGLVGALFVYAALTHDPQKSGGLDQALQDVLAQPLGAPALVLMALGLTSFGLFCFAWARHIDR
ncbi:MAG: DUF1206 domain-containing protein [Actinomycetes bacterium]